MYGWATEVRPRGFTALLLSLLFFHQLQGLEIGTIFSALAVGRFVDLYNRRLPLISRISALGARTRKISVASLPLLWYISR